MDSLLYISSEFNNPSITLNDMNPQNGYVNIMRLYPNGMLVIFEGFGRFEEYPVEISQDITKQIFDAAR